MKTKQHVESANSDNTVLTTKTYHWKLITEASPFGLKCLLINKLAGCAHIGILNRKDMFSTHYAAFPKFSPGDK